MSIPLTLLLVLSAMSEEVFSLTEDGVDGVETVVDGVEAVVDGGRSVGVSALDVTMGGATGPTIFVSLGVTLAVPEGVVLRG